MTIAVETGLKGMVDRVISAKSKHGPHVIAKVPRSKEIKGTITFSLNKSVWKEKRWPEPGTWVFLADIEERRAGWRALFARFWKPTDRQQLSTHTESTKQGLEPKQSPRGTKEKS